MDIRVLNQSFVQTSIVDVFESIIWIDRYDKSGEFELYAPVSLGLLDILQEKYYLQIEDSDKTMVIESIELKTDVEKGNKIIVRGRSLESILDIRIILRQIVLDTSLQTGIQTILNHEFISGIFPERNVTNFIFSASADPLVTSPTLKATYFSDNVYDVITALCTQIGLGYKILLNSSNQFVFSLYAGADRSYDQLVNPFVVFSPAFDNLLNSDYFHTNRYKKNYIFVAGDTGAADWNQGTYGDWAQAWTPDVGTGLLRREMYLDLSYMPKVYPDTGVPISDADYVAQLQQRGFEELAKNDEIATFDGEANTTNSYIYRTDFFLGDIVQVENEYGLKGRSRITEITITENLSGHYVYPTFEKLD